ncbi:glycoside hydrolase family 79 protein [Fistulina hepatica ATCC 64428]|uniref:Glycoside hydrolase family 79 protein n=1 Tax=Fistulina hepatica ATCC 64428 TaxID=1128425 RepID=A0A0D7ANZ5_9AGAR|nr:glycoside hydrolase family 79 protein [Fistulina hepatica ATCC 64428]
MALFEAVSALIPVHPPSSAPIYSPSLVSFSIEQDRWTDWAGTTSRNDFFHNTMDNLYQLSGAPPAMRIGAQSEDHTNYNPSVEFSEAVFPLYSNTTPYPEATSVVVGDGYYEIAKHLLPGTSVIWGVNFGSDNLTAAYLEADAALRAFATPDIADQGITLDYIEIGNEADLYMDNGFRSSSYNVSDYVSQWSVFAENIASLIRERNAKTQIIAGAFSGSTHGPGFSPQSIFKDGLLNASDLITLLSQHHYFGSFCSGSVPSGLLQNLMMKSSIRGNLTIFTPDIIATHNEGLGYALGETNSYACEGSGSQGAPGVSNTAGAALWLLDYALFAPQIGIEKAYFHNGVGYKYNLLQPVTLTRSIINGSTLASPLPPHIQPTYYAALIAAEAIGGSNTQAVELSLNNSWLAGYAFYEGGTLKRAVFINSEAWLQSDEGSRTRTSIHVNVTLDGSTESCHMTIKRLTIQHADDVSNVTYAGQSWETSDGRVSGTVRTEKVNVSAGVDIAETEVVLLHFY